MAALGSHLFALRRTRRSLTIAVALAASWSGLYGCGRTIARDRSPAAAAPVAQHPPGWDHDGDTDEKGGGFYDSDDHGVRYFGHAAGAADRRAVARLLRRYYAAVASVDSATVCELLDPSLVGETGGSSSEAGSHSYVGACAATVSNHLKSALGRTRAELLAVRTVAVRVRGDHGFGLLRVPPSELRYMPVRRSAGAWKVDALIDGFPL